MAPSNDTVPVLADGFLADIIEYHSDILIRGCEQNATYHWDSLDFFWKIYTGRATTAGTSNTTPQLRQGRSKHGRISNRRRMAQIIVACSQGEDDDDIAPMFEWSPPKWKWLRNRMDVLRMSLMRADSHVPLKDPRDENCAIDTRRLDHALFAKKYDKLMDILLVNELLSPLRGPILRQLEGNSSKRASEDGNTSDIREGQEPIIPPEDLQAFSQGVDAIENQRVRNFLAQFLQPRPPGISSEPRITNVEDIRQAMECDACNLEKVQAKVTSLVRSWSALVFKNRRPALQRLGYGEYIASNAINNTVMMSQEIRTERVQGKRSDGKVLSSPRQSHRLPLPCYNTGAASEENVPSLRDTTFDYRNVPRNADEKKLPRIHIQGKHQDRLLDMGAARKNLEISFRDPLPETIAVAEHVVAAKGREKRATNTCDKLDFGESVGSLYVRPFSRNKRDHSSTARNVNKRRKSAHALRFNDSEDEDYEIVTAALKVSELPVKTESRSDADTNRSPYSYRAPHRFSRGVSSGEARGRRKRFTEEEKRAIRKGVKKHGVGKWADIKAEFATILRERTNVQIKDCYRTMTKNGEI